MRFVKGLAATGFALVTLLTAGNAQAQSIELRFAYIPPTGSLYYKMALEVPGRVAEATDGEVLIIGSDSLVAGPQLASSVRDGRVDMAVTVHTYLAAEDPRMGLFNLPGVINTFDEFRAVCEAFYCQDLEDLWLSKWNSISLAQSALSQQVIWSKEPIKEAEDFRNKRIRVHNPQTAQVISLMGAKPTPLPFSEVVPGLERGVLDAMITSYEVGHSAEIWRSAPHAQPWQLGPISPYAFVINADVWNDLTEEQRTEIQGVFDEMQQELTEAYVPFEEASIDAIEENGGEIHVPADEEIATVNSAENARKVIEAWIARAEDAGFDGRAYLDRVSEAIDR